MRLLEITLPARDPVAVADGYAQLLGVPVTCDRDSATVTVGWSRLTFLRDNSFASCHHLAITIPDAVFDSAGEWISERTPILSDEPGADRFEASPAWNARSLYFAGPEGSVLELIARRDRDDVAYGPFDPHHLRGVSEVGVAVERPVTEVATALSSAGLRSYGDAPGAEFGVVGEVDGLLVLVAPGRVWFPTVDRPVGVVSTQIVAAGGKPGSHQLSTRAQLHLLG